jgi:Ca2+-binding EF-hand superfamily protein
VRRLSEAGCIILQQHSNTTLVKKFNTISKKMGDAPTVFKKLDVHGTGVVSYQELLSGCRKYRLGLTETEVEQLYLLMLTDSKGISYKDLVNFLQRDRQP